MSPEKMKIDVLDVSQFSYAERVTAAALQGLVNREGPRFFLDFGIYDEPSARRTNEDFMDDKIWYGKYRERLGAQDQRNLAYYQREHAADVQPLVGLEDAVEKYRGSLRGCVLWDAALPDTVNIALMLAGQESLLPVEAGNADWAHRHNLEVIHDLRGRWTDRVSLYQWALAELFPKCETGRIACIEPDWQRPEFLDYLVQHKIFTYNLSSMHKGLGETLLLLLSFGPAWLREVLFALHLDGPIRRFGVNWLDRHSAEIALNNQIQQAVKSAPFPTVFGWHTHRDDEMTFMLLLSANGLRLVPSHLAGNFSFHSRVKPLGFSAPAPAAPVPQLDPQGVYLTFTLSDGDQLMMMSTAELGSWYSPHRGEVAFNWECQPLLTEIAPALLEKFQRGVTPNDCLVAGPSGAGYIVPPLAPDLPAYMRETLRSCQQAGISVITTYVADSPRRILHQIAHQGQGKLNFLAGYAILDRAPRQLIENTMIIANQIPRVNQIWDDPEKLLASVKALAENPAATPCFIGTHLFAYRIGYDDIVRFAGQNQNPHIHIVRADTFLELARIQSQTHAERK
jgi:hypothetical protein